MKSPNDAPDPHVPVCRDPNQPLESSVNPPPLLSRQILKYDFAAKRRVGLHVHRPSPLRRDQPAEQLLGGWGGAVFDVFDGKKCFFACFRGCFFAMLASSCHSVQRLIIWQVRAV